MGSVWFWNRRPQFESWPSHSAAVWLCTLPPAFSHSQIPDLKWDNIIEVTESFWGLYLMYVKHLTQCRLPSRPQNHVIVTLGLLSSTLLSALHRLKLLSVGVLNRGKSLCPGAFTAGHGSQVWWIKRMIIRVTGRQDVFPEPPDGSLALLPVLFVTFTAL